MDPASGQVSTKTNFQPDSDVHITLEDQQKINRFAKLNAKFDDIKSELKTKQNELKNLEDAAEELVLLDDTSSIPFLTGEVFLYFSIDETNSALEREKGRILDDIKGLENNSNDLKKNMSDLKSQLYEKFGNHINLEAEEE